MLPLHLYVAGILLFTQHGHSQKQGDSCVIKNTNTLGICAPALTCQSARRDYETNRIAPTFCNHGIKSPIVCCSDDNSNNNNKSNEPTTQDNQRLSEKKCQEYSSRKLQTVVYIPLLADAKPTSISIKQCDYVKTLFLGGLDAETGELPYVAAIGWTNFEGTYSFLCGGSLISTKFVLTAAHCTKYSKMKDPIPDIVRLGDVNLDPTKSDGDSAIEMPIKNIIKHPQYKSPGKYHDIALLELASDVDFNAAIRPACLWNKPNFPGHTKAVATGWGVVDPGTLRTSDRLQKVPLTLFENDQCNNLLRTNNILRVDGFSDNQMCAGDLRGGMDTCQIDPGSPLQVESHEKCSFYIIGVRSFGGKCAQFGSPVEYTRVSPYLDWIESVVWPGES